jgi:diaminopimelate decarboxylase
MPAHPAGPRHEDILHPATLGDPPTDLNDLGHVWPLNTNREQGVLTISGQSVTDLVARFGSPIFVLDEEHFRQSARSYVQAYADADVYYASKAFLAGRIAQWADQEGLRLDVCSMGELEVALRAGVDPSRILFHGNNKSAAELRRALEVGLGRIVIDSFGGWPPS